MPLLVWRRSDKTSLPLVRLRKRSEALLAAFRNVKDFEAVEKFYKGKRTPEDEFFLNTLTREFNIPRDRVEQFSKVFLENLRYLRSFSAAPIETMAVSEEISAAITPAEKIPSPVVSKEQRVREFLDTCGSCQGFLGQRKCTSPLT